MLIKSYLTFVPEIWDATRRADPGSSHHHHPLKLPLSDVLGDVLQSLLLLACTTTATGEKPPSPDPPGRVCLSEKKPNRHEDISEKEEYVNLYGDVHYFCFVLV